MGIIWGTNLGKLGFNLMSRPFWNDGWYILVARLMAKRPSFRLAVSEIPHSTQIVGYDAMLCYHGNVVPSCLAKVV